MSENKLIGIIMEKRILDENTSILFPKTFEYGTIVNYKGYQYFEVESGKEKKSFLFAEDVATNLSEESVVSFIIDEETLLTDYNEDSLEASLKLYIKKIEENAYLSHLKKDTNTLEIEPISMEEAKELIDKLNESKRKNMNEYIKSHMVIKCGDDLIKEYDEIKDKIKKCENFQEIKDVLSKLQCIFSFLIENELIIDDLAISCLNDLTETLHSFDKELEELYDDFSLVSIKYITLGKIESFNRMVTSLTKDLDKKWKNELNNQKSKNSTKIDFKAMKRYLDDSVIGQEEAKIDIISVLKMNSLIDDYHHRKNCFLIGPTGSGKTLLMETVASYLDKVVEIYDTSQLTSAGYKGSEVTEILENLMVKSDGDFEKAQEAIVVLNEVDKKGSKKDNPAYRGVLYELLSFIEGTTYKVEYKDKTYNFDTRNLTIFLAGSFEELLTNRSDSSYKRCNMGFGCSLDKMEESTNYYRKLELDDLRKDGGIPNELLGRSTTIVQLDEHTKESLRRILTDSKMSCLLAEKRALKKEDIIVSWTESYLDALAEKALVLKTGARSLNAKVEESIKIARTVAFSNPGQYGAIHLTEDAVKDNYECILVDKEGNQYKAVEVINGITQQEKSQPKAKCKKKFANSEKM